MRRPCKAIARLRHPPPRSRFQHRPVPSAHRAPGRPEKSEFAVVKRDGWLVVMSLTLYLFGFRIPTLMINELQF